MAAKNRLITEVLYTSTIFKISIQWYTYFTKFYSQSQIFCTRYGNNLFGCCYCDNVLVSAKLFPLKLELKCTCVNRQNVLLLLKWLGKDIWIVFLCSTIEFLYRVVWKVSQYQESSLIFLKNISKAIFSSILTVKWAQEYYKFVLNILCVI